MESCLVGSAPKVLPTTRPKANYRPTIWDESLISYESYEATLCDWRGKAEALKQEVVKMLSEDQCDIPNKRSNAKLSLIDAIQRLGVAYHFEQQVEDQLAHLFSCCSDQIHADIYYDDLNTTALKFRLLREHGYNITSDVFRKFVNNKGHFHKSLCDDVDGLLSLYEATYLSVKGEAILDEALNFTTSSLRSLLPSLSPSLDKQVCEALYRPLRKRLPRLEARNYMSIYEQNEQHSEVLLHFAKLDFNILQKLHQKELDIVSRWWKDLDCPKNYPFARDRLVESYFWIVGVYFEPQYAMARRFLVQVIATTSIMDDLYDACGTREELQLFTDAVDRWDITAIADLPEYMKPCYEQLLDVFSKSEKELINQGRAPFGVQYAIKAMKRTLRAYMEEQKWLNRQDLPTHEEYMETALITSSYPMLSVASMVWMDDAEANEDTFSWMLNEPEIIKAASVICRLMDDIVSHKFEQEREHPPSAIECYTMQYQVSEEEACDVFRKQVEEAWKDINGAFLRPTPVAASVLMRVMNFSRVIEALYKEGDGYTHVTPAIKESIASILFIPVQV